MMYLAAGLGYLAGVGAAVILSRRLLVLIGRPAANHQQRRLIARVGIAGGLVALIPAFLLGTVIGGTFGRVIGERLAPSGAGAAAGLAIGLFAVACLTITLFAAVGGALGRLVGKN